MAPPKFRSAPKGPPSVTSNASSGAAFFAKPAQNPLSVPQNPFVEINLPVPEALTPSQVEEVVLWRDLNNEMKHSIYFLSNEPAKKDIERYSDKYLDDSKKPSSVSKIHAIETNVALFPEELHSVYHPERAQKVKKQIVPMGFNMLKFDDLQRIEEASEQLDDDKEPEEPEEEDYNEEELEDETDYNHSYFDPGDNYGDYDEDGGGGDYEPTF